MPYGLSVLAELRIYRSEVEMCPRYVQLLALRVLHLQLKTLLQIVERNIRFLLPIVFSYKVYTFCSSIQGCCRSETVGAGYGPSFGHLLNMI